MGTLVLGKAGLAPSSAVTAPEQSGAGVWSRLVASFVKSRQRAADREIARVLARNPGLARRVRESDESAWKQAADALPF
jgi:hypothetical protein